MVVALLLVSTSAHAGEFLQKQKRYSRVRAALANRGDATRAAFTKAGAVYPPTKIFIRVLKSEARLELWATAPDGRYVRVRDFEVCAASGDVGPKSQQGDLQVPEGFYWIDRFNPSSNFHLSLGINYPNQADRKRSKARDLGGDIFLHGDCVSIGCVAITDDEIELLYIAAVLARDRGQRRIPVHVFPMRMTGAKLKKALRKWPEHQPLWRELAEGYGFFETNGRPPHVRVLRDGHYRFR